MTMSDIFGNDTMEEAFKVYSTVDPLNFILKIPLKSPISKGSREPLRLFIRWAAERYNCEVPRININKQRIQAEVLIKHRHWREGGIDEARRRTRRSGGRMLGKYKRRLSK